MSNLSYLEMRNELCIIAKNIWERRLTNAAGGNIAVRVDEDRILISPSLMSERLHCILQPEQFMLVDNNRNIIEGTGKLSREADMHVRLLTGFKYIGAVIHAHPFWCMAFVAQAKEIPNVTEATMGRGSVGCIPYTKAYTPALAENIYNYFDKKRELAERKPIGVILPLHGVVVSGPDIFGAFSMLERIECDAFCNITKGIVNQISPDSVLG
jgi:L-fuculose-phosphate aldolase